MNRKIKYVSFVFVLLFAFILAVGTLNLSKTYESSYASYDSQNSYSFQSGRDGIELTEDGYLKVTFTLNSLNQNVKNNLMYWTVFLVKYDKLGSVDYYTHKYFGDVNYDSDPHQYPRSRVNT